MNIVIIPKGRGKFRTIYAPNPSEKARALKWAPSLEARHRDPAGVQHGFRPGRSSVTNALVHKNWRFTLSMDLRDFFDSVKPHHVFGYLNGNNPTAFGRFVDDCFHTGAARQGIPTSPAIANIAAAPMDADILKLNQQSRLGPMFVYTRYADDLTFSFNYPGIADMLKVEIPKLAEKHGFKINDAKTHLQSARQGRRVITGVAVSDAGTHLPRVTKRKLRAIAHQISNGLRGRGLKFHIARQREHKRKGDDISLAALIQGQHRGLLEWAKLRLPDGYDPHRSTATQGQAAHHHVSTTSPQSTTTTPVITTIGQRKFSI